MDNSIYCVQEIDSDGNITTEMFNNNREEAINFLKTGYAIIKQNHKGWQEEDGINYYAWKKNEKYVKIYLKIYLKIMEENTNDSKRNL